MASTKEQRIRWLADLSAARRRERAIIRAAAVGRAHEYRSKVGQCSRKRRTAEHLARLQGGLCYLCMKAFAELGRTPTIEHVHPKSRNGRNGQNRLAACEPCNVRKGDRLPYPCELIYLEEINRRNRPSGGRPERPSAAGSPAPL